MDEFKERQRAMWAAGDYATLSEHIRDVGERVVARAGVDAEMRVLDVACGAGNAAIPAARAGADVTGLDLVPELLDGGRTEGGGRRSSRSTWVEGDAEELPFEDGGVRSRVLDVRAHVRAAPPADGGRDGARVPRGRRDRALLLDARGRGGRRLRARPARTCRRRRTTPLRRCSGARRTTCARCSRRLRADFEFERHSTTIEAGVDRGLRATSSHGALRAVGDGEADARRSASSELRAEILAVWDAPERRPATAGFVLPQEYLLSVVRL